jgi:hypothetical protein
MTTLMLLTIINELQQYPPLLQLQHSAIMIIMTRRLILAVSIHTGFYVRVMMCALFLSDGLLGSGLLLACLLNSGTGLC